jgi:catechol 2,3-dioxygenase-like lactoylglutathione lyase family enzyme
MVTIGRAGPVVLGVRDPQRSIAFYTDVLGMELVTFLEDMQMAFFSFGERDHDLAVIKVPDDQPVGSSGLAHSAFRDRWWVRTTSGALRATQRARRRSRNDRRPRRDEESLLLGSRWQSLGVLCAGAVRPRSKAVFA